MLIRRSACATLLLILGIASVSKAWTSPDGAISVVIPGDGSLIEVPNPPAPAMAIWEGTQEQVRILVLTVDHPANARLDRAGLEEGTLNESKGTLISSTAHDLRGVPIYVISAKGTIDGQQLYLMQTIAAFNGKVYKLMVAGPSDVTQSAMVRSVFSSFDIVAPNPLPPSAPKTDPLSHRSSVNIAQIGWAVLGVALAVYLIRKIIASGAKQASKPSLGVVIEQRGEAVVVSRVTSDTPADRAGLLAGDQVVRCGGVPIWQAAALSQQLNSRAPGQTVQIVIVRGGQELTLTLPSY